MPIASRLGPPSSAATTYPGPLRSQVSRLWICAGFGTAFLFRLVFGLFSNMNFDDQKQIYLIGLKYYCTRLWPFLGRTFNSTCRSLGPCRD